MKRIFTVVAPVLFAAFAWLAVDAALPGAEVRADSDDPNGPKCMCRYQGQRFNLGEFACINSKLARCDMFLNNTSWTFLEDVCPTASYTPSLPTVSAIPASFNPMSSTPD